jgi:hypothetical protein
MDAILTVMDDWGHAIDQKLPIIAIFFDFAKAFDLVDHEILLEKLQKILPEWLVSWIAVYLSNRKQRVKVGDTTTEWKDVKAGVIQGSVLGPILFVIFIADINEYLPDGVEIEKYADDILNYIIGNNVNTNLPQLVVDGIQRWCKDNKMRLNSDKCKVMHFPGSIKKSKEPSTTPKLLLDGHELETVNSYKYLGVELNTELNWNQQWQRVKSLTCSVPFLIKQLRRTGFKRKILINVYRSLVLSHFNYSSPLLASATGSDKHEMQVFQNRILRIIGTTQQKAKQQYNLQEIEEHITKAAFKKIKICLTNPHHALRAKLLDTDPRRGESRLKIAKAKTEKYNNSIIMQCLRELESARIQRNRTSNLTRTTAAKASVREPDTPCPTCGKVFRGEKGLKMHKRACANKTQSSA